MRRNQRKPDALADLRKRLGSPSSDVRYQAYLDAQDLSAEQLWDIVASPAREANRSSRTATMNNIIAGTWVASGLFVINFEPSLTPFIASSVLIAWGIYVFTLFRRVPRQSLYISLSRLLEHQEDARFVGPTLLIHAEVTGRDVQASTRKTLLRLLSLLDDIHIRAWTGAHKAALLNLARHSWGDLELKFFALDALGRVGEADSIPVVRKLAEAQTSRIAERLYVVHIGRETTLRELEREQQMEQAIKHGAVMPAASFASRSSFENLDADRRETYMAAALYLKRKAEDSLNSILARQQQQQQTTVLLRAAEQPATMQAQALLRPAHDAGANMPNEQLLRPK